MCNWPITIVVSHAWKNVNNQLRWQRTRPMGSLIGKNTYLYLFYLLFFSKMIRITEILTKCETSWQEYLSHFFTDQTIALTNSLFRLWIMGSFFYFVPRHDLWPWYTFGPTPIPYWWRTFQSFTYYMYELWKYY